jgi:hypothetical protein
MVSGFYCSINPYQLIVLKFDSYADDSTLVIQNRELKIELEKLNMLGIRCKQIA